MRTEEQIELSDLSFAEANRELARRAGGAVHDEGGVLLFAGAHELPVLVNAAFCTGAAPPPAEVLARADAFFGPRGRGYTVLIRAHADHDLARAAGAAGLVPFGEPPAMVLEGPLTAARPGPGVALRRVEDEADAAAFARVMEEAYSSLGMPAGCAPLLVGRLDVLRAPHIASFVAETEAGVVAGAMVIVTHGVAGIYWVGTTPAARGRGLAELCTRAATNAGFDLGARMAALQASVMGEPIYRRMGYVTVTRYPQLVRLTPPPAPPASDA